MKSLREISEADRARIGGKAYNCARLLLGGFPVPDGVVVAVDASDADIRALPDDPWFDALPAGTLFAVRSSGLGEDSEGHSFAGIHETHLNVARTALVDAVFACRRSAGTEQASAYRRTRHLEGDAPSIGVALGVLIQRMIAARTSGVAFTIHPVTGADELVINTAPGLGEALVGGQVDPDEFRIRKSDRTVIASRASAGRDAPSLSPEQVQEIAAMLLRIEAYYGAPQDVEFCHDGRQFWIVQSRPITAAGTRQPETASTHHPAPANTDHPDIEWTRANLAEVLPEQLAPQVLDAFDTMLNRGQRTFMGRLLAPESELGPVFKAFHGRVYMNVSQLRRVVWLSGAAAADVLRSMGHPEAIHPDDEIPKRAPLREILRCVPDFVRLGITDARAAAIFARHERETRATLDRIRSRDLRTMTDREIWDLYRWWLDLAPDAIQVVFVMSAVLLREVALKRICARVGFSYERLVYPQLAAGQRSVSSQQAVDLVALAGVARDEPAARDYLLANDGAFTNWRSALAGTTFLDRFDHFLDVYGHRGRYESDWSIPRLHENPAPALFAIREQLKAPPQDIAALTRRQQADAAAAWREFEAKLTRWQRVTLLPRARSMIARLKKQYVWREQVRSDLTRILRYMRPYHLTLADRFVERGWIDVRDDYFMLLGRDIESVVEDSAKGPGLRSIAERRKAQLAAERALHLPLLMHESALPALLRAGPRPVSLDDRTLAGLCVSPGAVEADVVVMHDPNDFRTMARGAILVARATDPSWTPLFTLASGVIVEVGGMLSHASTIAREYGLPALANVKDATRILTTGDRVRLNASAGYVERLT